VHLIARTRQNLICLLHILGEVVGTTRSQCPHPRAIFFPFALERHRRSDQSTRHSPLLLLKAGGWIGVREVRVPRGIRQSFGTNFTVAEDRPDPCGLFRKAPPQDYGQRPARFSKKFGEAPGAQHVH